MLRLKDIMTRELVTLSPDLSLRDAMDVLITQHITGAPVVSGTHVVGVISLTDLVEFAAGAPGVPTEREDMSDMDDWENPGELPTDDEPPSAFFAELWDDAGADVAERFAETEGPEWNVLEEHTVGEAMNRKVCSLPPDAPVDHAAAVMRRAGIHRVLVMEGAALVGMVTTSDITDAVADHRITSRVYVFGTPAGNRGDVS